MKLLILGGTVFLGRHLVHAAQARGHEVTLFNRGKSNADLFSDVETLIGDRDGNLAALKGQVDQGRTWDAVVDPSGYIPRVVRDSAELLAGAVQHYTFISSISVYDDFSQPHISEDASVGTMADESLEEVSGETYGPLKALCEGAAEAAMPGRVLNIRPGLIVGPNDPTDRFTYWPVRVERGGDVLAPPRPEAPVQVIDVRDLAEWTLDMAEQRTVGIFNATGPAKTLRFDEFLHQCRDAIGSDAQFHWTDVETLAAHEVGPWMDLPLWLPEEMGGMVDADISKAIAAGLSFRLLSTTVNDTLQWAKGRPDDYEWRAGLRAEREKEVLADVLS